MFTFSQNTGKYGTDKNSIFASIYSLMLYKYCMQDRRQISFLMLSELKRIN